MSTDHFDELYYVPLLRDQSVYTLPVGEIRPYFSFQSIAHRVSEAQVSDNPVIRHTSVANKWKTIHLLLYPGHNSTQIQYNITFQREEETDFSMIFSVVVDTREVPQTNVSKTVSKQMKPTPTPEPVFHFPDIPEDKRGPKLKKKRPGDTQVIIEVPSVNVSLLPSAVRRELQRLEEKLLIGDITEKGFNITVAELLSPYKALAQKKQVAGSSEVISNGVKVDSKVKEAAEDQPSKQKDGNNNDNQDPPVTLLVPVPNGDVFRKELEKMKPPVKAVIERPLTSKLLNSLSQKIREAEKQKESINAVGEAVVGRRLQHFTSHDRGFLPWERRKYFQELLEVKFT